MKRVVVNGYTYETDLDVQVGDRVLLPGGGVRAMLFGEMTWEGTVTAIGSDCTGPCRRVICIVKT